LYVFQEVLLLEAQVTAATGNRVKTAARTIPRNETVAQMKKECWLHILDRLISPEKSISMSLWNTSVQ